MNTSPTNKKDRLERVIAQSGKASRREAKALILAKKVMVNGVIVTNTGFPVSSLDTITIADTGEAKKSYLFNKPCGMTTESIIETVSFPKGVVPIGRLDKASEGLIILSNDGVLTKTLTRVGSTVAKTYLVTVRENITDAHLLRMSRGIILEGSVSKKPTKPAVTSRMSRHSFTIVLHEGQKHQIRRMCAACGLTIDSLIRVGIGHLVLGSLQSRQYKILSPNDVAQLKQL